MEDHKNEAFDHALEQMRRALEPEGWKVYRSRSAVKAQWRWYRVSLRYKPKRHDADPWRARLRDRFPPMVWREARGADPDEALRPVIAEACDAMLFCEGRLGLAPNPSKSWLAHRVYRAVRRRS